MNDISENEKKRLEKKQPYHDKNEHIQDKYERAYQQQLNEFARLSGDDPEEDIDLEFQQIDQTEQDQQYDRPSQKGQQQRTNSNNTGYNRNTSNNTSGSRSNNGRKQSQRNNSRKRSGTSQKKRSDAEGKRKTKTNKTTGKSKNKSNASVSRNRKAGKNVERKKRHYVKTVIKVILIILIILFILLNVMLIRYIGMVNIVKTHTREYTNASMNSSDVRNILIIGSDTRDIKERGRTDSMIILSVNKKTKEITMTSLMRDMYVNIKGKTSDGESYDSWGKINSAYVYGGAELLLDTIEYNFDIAINDYVYIDFNTFVDIVDSVDGIDLDITDEEAKGMAPQTREVNDILKRDHNADVLTHGGKIHANGYQALAYARLRYVGNADFERTERQRTVLTKVIDEVRSSPLKIDSFAKACAKNLSTNMSKADMYFLCWKALFSMNYDMKSLRLPAEGDYSYGDHNGESTLDIDIEKCRQLLKTNIYKN